ncbi:malate synthase A [archaeon 13_1_40CM_2_52_13]|nr:MAG: malate synthase A [archaeon 13_1_40CM_2_52_13]OLE90049.1 MAG: malate synthase A [Crenarchaeota archaeon 13_1_20CM_2_51_8]
MIPSPTPEGFEEILTPDALAFVGDLVREFSLRLDSLLQKRILAHARLRTGTLPNFLDETREIRTSEWKVGQIPAELRQRRVEITGPVDRKMVINALNSGADVYMADFEDSHSPTWKGTLQGQANLRDAVNRAITYTGPDRREYMLGEKLATLFVRPRGLHLTEKHVQLGSNPTPAFLFDYGLFVYHNAKKLVDRGSGPYIYIPKLESHLEARLWNDLFEHTEKALKLPHASIKCSVLIETILAAFQMDEILHSLRERITALNFGRWDYIFSLIKFLCENPRFVVPERPLLPMTTPFLKSCSVLLAQTCHKRGAYAIGGMAAQVPIRGDPRSQEAIEKVLTDKKREVAEGYQGAWVAHPGLVPVVMKVFTDRSVESNNGGAIVEVGREDLLKVPEPKISEHAVRANIAVSLRYLESWLGGLGCVAINNLMEDTATVEICRAQIWQWIHHSAKLVEGPTITRKLFRSMLREETARIREEIGLRAYHTSNYKGAEDLLDKLTTSDSFPEFMTLMAYDHLA